MVFLMLVLPLASAGLTVSVPGEGVVYDSKSLTVSLSYDSSAKFYYSDNTNPGRWRKLCSRYDLSCEKKIRVKEGNNSLAFKAVNTTGQTSDVTIVNFSVDSKKPRISTRYPRANSLVNNNTLFSVEYTEDNLRNVTLFYGENISTKTNCESGRHKTCEFDVDLTGYNGQDIFYWFVVSDNSSVVISRKTKISVDTTAPDITNSMTTVASGDGTAAGKRVEILVDVNEANFKDIKYTDSNLCGLAFSRVKTLCNKLKVGRCIKTQRFCTGDHVLTLVARDKAGNEVTQDLGLFNVPV